jgi:hypothetical protein
VPGGPEDQRVQNHRIAGAGGRRLSDCKIACNGGAPDAVWSVLNRLVLGGFVADQDTLHDPPAKAAARMRADGSCL